MFNYTVTQCENSNSAAAKLWTSLMFTNVKHMHVLDMSGVSSGTWQSAAICSPGWTNDNILFGWFWSETLNLCICVWKTSPLYVQRIQSIFGKNMDMGISVSSAEPTTQHVYKEKLFKDKHFSCQNLILHNVLSTIPHYQWSLII